MRIGLIGLGRMGLGMTERLVGNGHEVVGWDLSADAVRRSEAAGAEGAGSLAALVSALTGPRVVWVMVPHGEPTRVTVVELLERLEPDDVIIDGGNSRYTESLEHAARSREKGVHFLDIGVSGGIWGLEAGFNLMAGGPQEAFARVEPVLSSLAAPDGYALVGPSGAGHFVKMIHNAVEYGMLQALGEGFECLHRSPFELDLRQIAALWQNGSVVRSWLLDLLVRALDAEGNDLESIGAWVDDSGTGRWTVDYALENAIPVPAISTALWERFDSRNPSRFSYRAIAALRQQFGGHAVHEE